ncbi:MAG: hypothetical protein ACK42L_09990, partial [Thermoanaerobaculum sp.]
HSLTSVFGQNLSGGQIRPVEGVPNLFAVEVDASDVVARYREKFRDEEPVVEQGLRCQSCGLTYPVVSDIPVMLVDEALPATSQ